MGSAHNIKLRVLRMRIIGMVLIGVIALLCSTNGWGITLEEYNQSTKKIPKGFIGMNTEEMNQLKAGAITSEQLKQRREQEKKLWREEALKEIEEKAPERCVCSDEGIVAKNSTPLTVNVLNCKCGEVQCVVNLKGGVSCLKQGLFK